MLNGFECLTADQLVLKHLSTWRQVRESEIASVYLEAGKRVRDSICLPGRRYGPAVAVSFREW